MTVPDSLRSTTRDGETITLNHTQLLRAETIISTANVVGGLGNKGKIIALMTALVESTLRILSNIDAYPESGNYPNDGDGGDHDSLGIFQQRPTAGWGTVAELMDPVYSARAFYGGPSGPNYPSPAGVLDISGWETMDNGEVCQAVQVSAFPDRYQNYEPVAIDILNAIGGTDPGGGGNIVKIREMGNQLMVIYDNGSKALAYPTTGGLWYVKNTGGPGPGTASIIWPWPISAANINNGHPEDGFETPERPNHEGMDWGFPPAVPGAPNRAAGAGTVIVSGDYFGYGQAVVIDHGTINGHNWKTLYGHNVYGSLRKNVGDTVFQKEHIGDVGNTGNSFGEHLHWETWKDDVKIDPLIAMAELNPANLDCTMP